VVLLAEHLTIRAVRRKARARRAQTKELQEELRTRA
jgi:hypothetical protein